MKKVISYRQKLIELARIYKIDKVFDQNLKHTTYELEIILLKSKVPLPSRRGYISHVFINKVFNPLLENSKFFLSIVTKYTYTIFNISKYFKNSYQSLIKYTYSIFNINKYFKNSYQSLIKYTYSIFSISKYFKNSYQSLIKYTYSIFNISKYLKKLFTSIENYFKFAISNIVNFFKTLSKIIVEALNDIYNFKVKEKIIKNIFSTAAYASLVVLIVFTGI